jgi:dihydrofolate synthase/folylpolyglutamate synthase
MTSPHINFVEERACINSKHIKPEILSDALVQVKNICEEFSLDPTYFVALSCAIFLLFKMEGVEYAVIETGLGGLYDSTNVIKKPLLSVITSIGFDHKEQLGNSLASIAFNKAGIIKKNCPVLCAQVPKEAKEVIYTEAINRESKIYFSDDLINNLSKKDECIKEFDSFLGYKKTNALTAYAASNILGISHEDTIAGIFETNIPGRVQHIKHNDYEIILDAAHNPDGVFELLYYINNYLKIYNFDSLHFIFGFLARKDWRESINSLNKSIKIHSLKPHIYIYNFSDEAVNGTILINEVKTELIISAEVINTIESTIEKISKAHLKPLIVTFGSFNVLKDIYSFLDKENRIS